MSRSTEVPLFDLERAVHAGRVGMEMSMGSDRVADWRTHAHDVIEQLARRGTGFTADDLIARVGLPPKGSENVVGAVFSGAARQGLIVRVGYRQSTRVATHGRVQAVWYGAEEYR